MKKNRYVIALLFFQLSCASGFGLPDERDGGAMETNVFRILPQPELSDDYVVDKVAMRAYYKALFGEMKLREILDLLDREGVLYSVENEGRNIKMNLRHAFEPDPIVYIITVEVGLEDGIFSDILDIYGAGLLVP